MRVRVYWNLHKKIWSVVDLSTGRVAFHRDYVRVTNCKLVVRQKGRERVLQEKKKNVHAFVVGDLNDNIPINYLDYVSIRYNPYQTSTFVKTETGEAVHEAKAIVLNCVGRVFGLL